MNSEYSSELEVLAYACPMDCSRIEEWNNGQRIEEFYIDVNKIRFKVRNISENQLGKRIKYSILSFNGLQYKKFDDIIIAPGSTKLPTSS